MSMLLEVGDVWVLSLDGRRAALEPIIQIIRSCVIIRCTNTLTLLVLQQCQGGFPRGRSASTDNSETQLINYS
jgi:hypothetical protein